jgi:hypothetical protein
MNVFAAACKEFTVQEHRKPILIVEDLHRGQSIHQGAAHLAGDLVRIHNDGFLNVVYTMSDFTSVGFLRQGKHC